MADGKNRTGCWARICAKILYDEQKARPQYHRIVRRSKKNRTCTPGSPPGGLRQYCAENQVGLSMGRQGGRGRRVSLAGQNNSRSLPIATRSDAATPLLRGSGMHIPRHRGRQRKIPELDHRLRQEGLNTPSHPEHTGVRAQPAWAGQEREGPSLQPTEMSFERAKFLGKEAHLKAATCHL